MPSNRTAARRRVRTLLAHAASVRRAFPRGAMGLETAALQALLHVWLEPDAGASAIAAALAIDRSTASHALATLLEEGLVVRAPTVSDGRRHGYVTSAAGERLVVAFLSEAAEA